MELELFCECPSAPYAPAVDGRGRLVFTLPDLGCVHAVDEESAMAAPYPSRTTADTRGHPVGIAYDADGVLFAADLAHQAIVTVSSVSSAGNGNGINPAGNGSANGGNANGVNGGATVFARDHEDERLLGPAGIAFSADGTLFFTDAGPEGETGLARPRGSVFAVTADGQLLRPLALHCLARPTGIAVSGDGRYVYVCETAQNRVIRFVERPAGVWHASVFATFSGLLGPVAITVDHESGNIYVARSDYVDPTGASEVFGMVSTLDAEGNVIEEVATPHPEITGITLRREGDPYLYITEASSRSVFRMKVSSEHDQ